MGTNAADSAHTGLQSNCGQSFSFPLNNSVIFAMDRFDLEELCPPDDIPPEPLSTGGRLASKLGTLDLDEEELLNGYHRLRPPLEARYKCKSKSAAILKALTKAAKEDEADDNSLVWEILPLSYLDTLTNI